MSVMRVTVRFGVHEFDAYWASRSDRTTSSPASNATAGFYASKAYWDAEDAWCSATGWERSGMMRMLADPIRDAAIFGERVEVETRALDGSMLIVSLDAVGASQSDTESPTFSHRGGLSPLSLAGSKRGTRSKARTCSEVVDEVEERYVRDTIRGWVAQDRLPPVVAAWIEAEL